MNDDMRSSNVPPVVIFGGTFDPPHEGHIQVIKTLLERGVKLVVIALTSQNPFKNRQPNALEHRREMLRLVLDYEKIKQASSAREEGVYICDKSYQFTCEFVDYWRSRDKREFAWAIGEDLKDEVRSWKNWNQMELKLEILPEFAGRHSTAIRNGQVPPHPALRNFVVEHKLYPICPIA